MHVAVHHPGQCESFFIDTLAVLALQSSMRMFTSLAASICHVLVPRLHPASAEVLPIVPGSGSACGVTILIVWRG